MLIFDLIFLVCPVISCFELWSLSHTIWLFKYSLHVLFDSINNHIFFARLKFNTNILDCIDVWNMNNIFYTLQHNDKILIKYNNIIRSIYYNIYITKYSIKRKTVSEVEFLIGPLPFHPKQFLLHIHFYPFSGNILFLFLQNLGRHQLNCFTILSLRLLLRFSQICVYFIDST